MHRINFDSANLRLKIGLTLGMLKKLIPYLLISFITAGCGNQGTSQQADNAIDGGRNFIENYMKGDMKQAKLFVVESPENKAYFKALINEYFGLDKEGRMQLRQASLQINEIKSINDQTTVIYYQNSFDKKQRWLKVISTNQGWKVDLKYSYEPKI
jgi:hypothetical protein